jgi:hypothetical protein
MPVVVARSRVPSFVVGLLLALTSPFHDLNWIGWLGFGLVGVSVVTTFLPGGGVKREPIPVRSPVEGRWIAVNSPADKVPSHGVHSAGQRRGAGDEPIAGADDRVDHDTAAFAGHRVGGERHARRAGRHHRLNQDGEPRRRPSRVRGHAYVERRAPTDPNRVEQRTVATHVEHRREQTGVGGLGAVFVHPGRADGERNVAPRADSLDQVRRNRGGDVEIRNTRLPPTATGTTTPDGTGNPAAASRASAAALLPATR